MGKQGLWSCVVQGVIVLVLLGSQFLLQAQNTPTREYIYLGGRLVAIDSPPPALGVPGNLTASVVSSSQINLSWLDTSAAETGFKIERKTGAGGTWTQIDTVGANATTYSNTGLTASTAYFYRVRAYNASGDSAYSNEASATTSADGSPTPPSGLSATSSSSSQINLAWTDNSSNETGFKIERKTGAGGTYAQIDTVGANVTSYSNTGLGTATTYFYRVRAYNGLGDSGYSNEPSATTSDSAPSAPSSLTATAASGSQINLAWADNSSNETGFKIERKTGAEGTWAQIDTAAANVTSYSNTGLTAGTTYFYRVRTYNGIGDSAYSNESSATTSDSVPAAPTDLTSQGVSTSQINLWWTDNSNNETGFKIERKTGANGTWAQIDTAAANATTYSNTGLTGGTNYVYRIRATNSGGDSAYSNESSSTTLTPMGPPSNLTATAVSDQKINLRWTDNSANESGFMIQRRSGGSDFIDWVFVGTNVTSFSDTSLLASTTFDYRVRGTNPGGDSTYSNIASATTFAPDTTPPSAPTNLVATAASTTQVSLAWTASTDNLGVDHYNIERKSNNGALTQIATSTIASYTDNSVSAGVTYVYRVRAVDVSAAANLSGYSNVDLATTIMFADDPIIVGVTLIKAQHIYDLRQAVNAVRACAGLSAATWTDTSLPGVVVKAVHIQELRTNLNAALTALGFSAPSYTDSILTVGVTPIKKVHIDELRQNVK